MDYLVESHHTPQECMTTLDKMSQKPEIFQRFEWGCHSGEHTGWAIVQGTNETTVRNMIPADMEQKTKVIQVEKYTPEEIRQMHE